MDQLPAFLDCEASSFGRGSYPIAVAWSDAAGAISRCLIDPSSVPAWTDWDPAAERIHGIDRDRLARHGLPPAEVARRLEADLAGGCAHSDAPDYDGRWLGELFARALGRPPRFALAHADEVLLPRLLRPGELMYQAVSRLDALKARLRPLMAGAHDAGYDVGYLIQLWRAAGGAPVKMNHGAGPLPATTATGTFIRVRREPG